MGAYRLVNSRPPQCNITWAEQLRIPRPLASRGDWHDAVWRPDLAVLARGYLGRHVMRRVGNNTRDQACVSCRNRKQQLSRTTDCCRPDGAARTCGSALRTITSIPSGTEMTSGCCAGTKCMRLSSNGACGACSSCNTRFMQGWPCACYAMHTAGLSKSLRPRGARPCACELARDSPHESCLLSKRSHM